MADASTPADPVISRDPSAPQPTAASEAGTASEACSAPGTAADLDALSDQQLLELLQADRLWLLRQIDSGAWPEWRLDLAALERELGELLDRVSEHAGFQA